MTTKPDPIMFRFIATFNKLSTRKDGGISITIDVPDVEVHKVRDLMDYKNKLLDCVVTVEEPETFGGSRFSMEGRGTPEEVEEQ